MDAHKLKIEVLVPKAFVWWTFLALAADPFDQFAEIKFVKDLSESADVVIVDACFLGRIVKAQSGARVIVLLWDGYQNYLVHKSAIEEISQRVRQVELRIVGDPSELDARYRSPNQCGRLYTQRDAAYDKSILSSEKMKAISFSSPFTKMMVLHRSTIISLKVVTQLILGRRCLNYMRTKFVFCGQSGLPTLQAYCRSYGIGPDDCAYDGGGLNCDQPFIVRWVAAIQERRDDPTSPLVARALLRLIALRALAKSRGGEIFLNIYPEKNVNAYQAGMLFKRHVFLEFGGINGDEAIYPRTADLAFHKRYLVRFDSTNAVQRLYELTEGDVDAMVSFVAWYEEQVLSIADGCPTAKPSRP